MKSTPERFGDVFERARRHWRTRQPAEPIHVPQAQAPLALTVAISRETGAGAGEVARALGRQLDWPVYDRELIEKISEQSGLRTELLDSVDEKQSHWLVDCLAAFAGTPNVGSAAFARQLAETLLALAAHGQCVIVGRGATVILPEATTLRVRLVAPLNVRISRIQQQFGLSEREAERRVAKTDSERSDFVRNHFHRDASDVHLYDLTLGTGRLSPEQCAGLIVGALQQLQAVPQQPRAGQMPAK